MDIGTLSGQIDLDDLLSGKLNAIASEVTSFADKHDSAMGKVKDSFGQPAEAAKAFGETLKLALEDPVAAGERLAQQLGGGLLGGLKALGPEAAAGAVGIGLLTTAVISVAAAVFELTNKAAESGEKVLEFSRKTGIAVENVGALEFAVKAAGGSLDATVQILRMVEMRGQAANAETGKFGKALADIGINAEAFNKMDSESKLLALAQGFQEGSKSGNDMADAMAIMGRSGVSSLELLHKLTPELLKMGEAMGVAWTQDTVEKAERFKVELGVVETALGSITTRIGIALIPQMEAMIRKFVESPNSMNQLLAATQGLARGLGVIILAAGDVAVAFGKVAEAALFLAGTQALLEQALHPSETNAKRVVDLARAYSIAKESTDAVYNATQALGKTLESVTISAEGAVATNLKLNKTHVDIGETISKEAKAVQSLQDQWSGAALAAKIKEVETAYVGMQNRGLKPTSQEMDKLVTELLKFRKEGGGLGTVLDGVVAKYITWNTAGIKVTDGIKGLLPLIPAMTQHWKDNEKEVEKVIAENEKLEKKWRDMATVGAGELSKGLLKNTENVFPQMKRTDASIAEAAKLDAQAISILSDQFVKLGQLSGGALGSIFSGLGQMIVQLETASRMTQQIGASPTNLARETPNKIGGNWGAASVMFSADASNAQKAAAAVQSAAAVYQGALDVWASSSQDATKAAGAMHGAISGAKAGAAFGPYGMAIGAVVGAIAGMIHTMTIGRRTIEDFAKSFDTIAPGSGFDEMHAKLLELGQAGEDMWVKLTQQTKKGDKAAALAEIQVIKDALAGLADDVKKYSLTAADMADPSKQLKESNKAADDLAKSFVRLTGAGYDQDKVLKAMAGDTNAWLANALEAGTKIPASMAPIIEKLIRTGQLTEENARLMLGLGKDTMPTLADITAAADRYGLKLDELGPKVQQLQITDKANQIIKDFKLLTLAGADFNQIMKDTTVSTTDAGGKVTQVTTGMHHDLQNLVTDALKTGSSIPIALQPILQSLIDAGGPNGLVDQFGNKLTGLSGLKFEKPLSESIDALSLALSTMTDKLVGKGGLADQIKRAFKDMAEDAANLAASIKLIGTPGGAPGTLPGGTAPPGTPGAGLQPGSPQAPGSPSPSPTPQPAPQPGESNGAETSGLGATSTLNFNVDGETFARAFVRTSKDYGLTVVG